MQYFIYILSSGRNGTLYIGVTKDIVKRVWEHKSSLGSIFTTQHGVHQLVYVETADDALSAIQREKQLKKWKRAWKIALIEKANPYWNDLYSEII